ncbi:uncharacterized protein MKZ38_007337 [Zalerion maritima]|uniref:Chromatin modification-related protein EAF6 n=1 Tax=Zalerion maritima TaxID=339359 RepID=A0AAD5RWY3_9PEZI|nr:uncharacterized protein MKZ38_007337 [Zalerion maritima]
MPPPNATKGESNTGTQSRAQELRSYEDSRTALRELLAKREKLRAEITELGETIERQEAEYVENNPTGNIIQGWDGLLKGGNTAEAKRRRTIPQDSMKIFSRSHISYNPQATSTPASATSTPATSHTPTPHSASFARGESGSGTPVSAGPTNKGVKRGKKHEEDSETDHRESKKARGNGSSRK